MSTRGIATVCNLGKKHSETRILTKYKAIPVRTLHASIILTNKFFLIAYCITEAYKKLKPAWINLLGTGIKGMGE